MGCGSSQSVAVVNPNETKKPTSKTNIKLVEPKKNEEMNSSEKKTTNESGGKSFMPLIPLPGAKASSAHSSDSGKNSHLGKEEDDDDDETIQNLEKRNSIGSYDSGYLDNEYKHVITEKSDQNLREKVEKEFVDRNELELSVVGKGCPRLLSEKEKQDLLRREEKRSIELLEKNGLVQKPIVIKDNYAHYEIVEDRLLSNSMQTTPKTDNSSYLLPPKVLPVRLLQRERTKPAMTADQIEEKLERAYQRKMEQNKLRSSLNGSASSNRRGSYAITKTEELDPDVIERQRKLREIRDKLKAKNADIKSPRSKELVNELEHFRPKSAAKFKPSFE